MFHRHSPTSDTPRKQQAANMVFMKDWQTGVIEQWYYNQHQHFTGQAFPKSSPS